MDNTGAGGEDVETKSSDVVGTSSRRKSVRRGKIASSKSKDDITYIDGSFTSVENSFKEITTAYLPTSANVNDNDVLSSGPDSSLPEAIPVQQQQIITAAEIVNDEEKNEGTTAAGAGAGEEDEKEEARPKFMIETILR